MTGAAPAPPALGVPHRLQPLMPAIASGLAAIIMACLLPMIVRGPEPPLILMHLVVLALASGAVYLLDDSAQQVTAVAPRSLLRRRAVTVAHGFLVASACWGAVALLLGQAFVDVPLVALTWEAAGLFWLGVAGSAVVSRRDAEPGNLVAGTLGLLVIGALISRPFEQASLLIANSDDPSHAGWWALSVLVAAGTVVAASRR